jgi:signal peptidase I
MRADVASEGDLAALSDSEQKVRKVIQKQDLEGLTPATDVLEESISRVMPARRFPLIREYVEIFAVALGVAMGCRAYFVQPYKIPTGSMQPTLYGITYFAKEKRGISDRMPLKLVKWIVTGEWYSEIKAQTSGKLSRVIMRSGLSDQSVYDIGGIYHELPRHQECRIPTGSKVAKGDILWSGIKVSGDHVFVNRMSWHYRSPKRSEVSVFETDGIEGVRPDTHYIKRLVGLPGDSLTLEEPNIRINGKLYRDREVGRIAADPERGYRNPPAYYGTSGAARPTYLPTDQTRKVGERQYVMFGDNTSSSHDSRY